MVRRRRFARRRSDPHRLLRRPRRAELDEARQGARGEGEEVDDAARDVFGGEAPGYSREQLVRRLAYRVQELAQGGVSQATRATLRAIAERDGAGGHVAPLARRNANAGGPAPGTRLVREWHGKRHEVVVVSGGFDYQGKIFKSLSGVAKAITGQHWNGPLFFGIRSRRKAT